jgi:hypothetical protein
MPKIIIRQTELPDATVNVNGALLTTVPAGNTENVEVLQSSGIVAVGTIDTGVVRVADSDLTLNGGAFLSVKAEDSQDIELLDQDDVAIVPLSVVGNVIKVDIPVASVQRSTAKLMRTGSDVSYRTGDDFNVNAGRETNFLTLASAPLKNDGTATVNTTTNRFTDELGGQTYTNGIVLDWSTWDGVEVLAYAQNPILASSWNDAIDSSLTFTAGGFSGWHLTNQNEIFNLFKWQSTNATSAYYKMNYPPFNITADRTIWTSTTYALGTGSAYSWRLLNGIIGVPAKTSNTLYYFPCRYFNISEL